MCAMMESILVAVDISRVSQSAFKQALALASSMRAKLVVVGVTPRYEGNMNRLKIADANEQLSEPFRKSLEDAASYAASLGLEIQTVHRIGEPSAEIVRVAEEEGVDLIVLGNEKRSKMEQVLLGGIRSKIVDGSPCDVMLVPEMSEIRFGKILVGINGTPAGNAAGHAGTWIWPCVTEARCTLLPPSIYRLMGSPLRSVERCQAKRIQGSGSIRQTRGTAWFAGND